MMWVLDFYDFATHKAVKSSKLGYSIDIIPVPSTAFIMCSGPLRSWERNAGYRDDEIFSELERFNMPEGCLCALMKAGHVLFYFEAPKRKWEWKKNVKFIESAPACSVNNYH
jgi:hypothetical protein